MKVVIFFLLLFLRVILKDMNMKIQRMLSSLVVGLLATSAIAQPPPPTFSANGVYVFSGVLTVQKNLPPINCNVTVEITVTGVSPTNRGTATITDASVSPGHPICGYVSLKGFPISLTFYEDPIRNAVVAAGVHINIAEIPGIHPADSCAGTMIFEQAGSANTGGPTPSELYFSDPTSNVAYTNGLYPNVCRLTGTLGQASGPANFNYQ